MSAFFLDSSALTKAYVNESGSSWVQSLLDVTANHELYASRVVGVEVTSAIDRHAPPIPLPVLNAALADLRYDLANTLDVIDYSVSQSEEAMELVEKHRLRAYDAVQPACALEVARLRKAMYASPRCLVSADLTLNAAAVAEGIQMEDPNQHP
jgi:hypothetical protein